MRFLKPIVLVLLFVLVLIYAIKTTVSLRCYFSKYQTLSKQYSQLLKDKQDLEVQLESLTKKVKDIRSSSLNADLLKERLKSMLNYKDKKELVITN